MSLSNYLENEWLKTLRGGASGTNFTAPSAVYVKLHTGDPGEDGTSNAAGNTTRQAATFAAPSSGSMAISADVTWTSVNTAETYSHVSLWDASSGGNCLGAGSLSASKTVAVGDTFTLPSSTGFTFTLD